MRLKDIKLGQLVQHSLDNQVGRLISLHADASFIDPMARVYWFKYDKTMVVQIKNLQTIEVENII